MVTRRNLLGAAAGAGVLALTVGTPAGATISNSGTWAGDVSANGWRIQPDAIAAFLIGGSTASVALRRGDAAAVLLHVARRWHYEIAPLDTGEGGGIAGHLTSRAVRADFESNQLSGTAVVLHPTAYPLGGSERLWPHQEAIVRDILADCAGTVVWGGHLTPAKASHFHLAARPGSSALARVAAQLDTGRQRRFRSQTAGVVADPAAPPRRVLTRKIPRPR
ncbi:hypothetical protein [Micromonospora sp. MA102]|uniref:hypothetical protein n=1 Tax=Micromonospora sp. MA102 TaxID=2952755 RepID=UPI0021C80DB5|nr:hypothetical protein [Micromonospora sp. MA102]